MTDDQRSAATPGSPSGEASAPLRFDDRERPLAPKVRTSWRIGAIGSLLPPAVVVIALAFVFAGRWGWAAVAGFALLGAVTVGWHPRARYARWRWQFADLAVELRYGVLVRRHETVPYFRIQQIDIVQGPLDRLLDLATLQVTTASSSGRAALPGIANADAPEVRAELLARAAAAVADHPGDLRDAV